MTEALRDLPFLPEFDPKLADGSKTATARSKRYGLPGDRLRTRVGVIVLDSVQCISLGEVAGLHYAVEGCASPQEFIDIWWRIHPRKGYDPATLVWFHRFHLESRWPASNRPGDPWDPETARRSIAGNAGRP